MDRFEEHAKFYSESLTDWFKAGDIQQRRRDKWIIDQWIESLGFNVSEDDVLQGERPDFFINGKPIEVTEVQREGRKRGDEYKEVIKLAGVKNPKAFTMEFYHGAEEGVNWILSAVQNKMKKYSSQNTSCWILVVYANFWGIEDIDFDMLRDRMVRKVSPPFRGIDVLYQGTDNQSLPVYNVEAIWELRL